MIRVVLDNSALISYLLSRGTTTSGVIACIESGLLELISSEEILEELRAVLERPEMFAIPAEDRRRLLELMGQASEVVTLPDTIPPISRDPRDDKFIACAVAGEADFLITGDKDLLVLDGIEGIRIVSPGQFLALLREAGIGP